MNKHSASVLVVLPTLGDRPDMLVDTLESVRAQRKDVTLTLVVVAPRHADAARELAAQYGAVVVDDSGDGISDAINRGLAARVSETYYAWIGDDDVFKPGGLRALLNLMTSPRHPIVAYGACEYISPENAVIAVSRAGEFAKFLLPWGPDLIPHPGSMIRLDAINAAGGFDPSLKYAMDLDLFLKLRKQGEFVSTREIVSGFRWHPDSLTVSNRAKSSAEAESVKLRYTPKVLRPLSPVWLLPVRWASAMAANRLNARARRLLR